MDNTFTSAARRTATYTTTENGHLAASTTGEAVLDLYGVVGALREADEQRITSLFEAAVGDNKLLTAKTMFYARDIRGGVGERDLFRTMLHYAAIHHPEMVKPNLKLIPEFGRWDDMYALVGTALEKPAFNIMYEQFVTDFKDMRNNKPISLLAKWLKSVNASSTETRYLGRRTAFHFGISEPFYRKKLSEMRAYLKVLETQMSSNQWSNVEYDKVPSRAGLMYREAFLRHDEKRYQNFINSVIQESAKINTAVNTPQDLVHLYMPKFLKGNIVDEDPTVEAMWKNLPDFVDDDENILCLVDVSGSMYGRPIEVSTGLGIYFAQKNRGAFHNLMLTFTSTPNFVSLKDGMSLREMLRTTLNMDWGGSTNLNLACEEILKFAKRNHVPNSDMPRRLLIISDMEIDEAAGYYYVRRINRTELLHANELQAMYKAAGYTMPQVIYWNVNSHDNRFQTRSDVPGTMLASGSSPAIFKAIMALKDLEITPMDAMREVLNSDRYKAITVEE